MAGHVEEWFCHNVLGWTYGQEDKAREALEALTAAAKLYPNSINVQQNLAVAYAQTDQDSLAAVAFEKAIALGSKHSLTSVYLCQTYVKLGQSALKSNRYALAWQYARRAERMRCKPASALIEELKTRAPEPNP